MYGGTFCFVPKIHSLSYCVTVIYIFKSVNMRLNVFQLFKKRRNDLKSDMSNLLHLLRCNKLLPQKETSLTQCEAPSLSSANEDNHSWR